MPNRYVSPPMKLSEGESETFTRADLQLLGVRHGGASYEARIFVNNTDADQDTEPNPGNGYAGKFSIFGHGGCYGEEGHCDVVERRPYDPRPLHPLTPLTKYVVITSVLRQALEQSDEFTITIVADPLDYTPPDDGLSYLPEFNVDRDNVLEFDQLRVLTYR